MSTPLKGEQTPVEMYRKRAPEFCSERETKETVQSRFQWAANSQVISQADRSMVTNPNDTSKQDDANIMGKDPRPAATKSSIY